MTDEINTQVDHLDEVPETSLKKATASPQSLELIKASIPVIYASLETVEVLTPEVYSWSGHGIYAAEIDIKTHLPVLPEGFYWLIKSDPFMGKNYYRVYLKKPWNAMGVFDRTLGKKLFSTYTTDTELDERARAREAAVTVFNECGESLFGNSRKASLTGKFYTSPQRELEE